MERLTRMLNGNFYVADQNRVTQDEGGYCGDVVERLAKFENVYDDLVSKQNAISKELEKLRSEDKTHSVKFKQLLANKMTNANILILFESYGIK